jgi:hypothetical protein
MIYWRAYENIRKKLISWLPLIVHNNVQFKLYTSQSYRFYKYKGWKIKVKIYEGIKFYKLKLKFVKSPNFISNLNQSHI